MNEQRNSTPAVMNSKISTTLGSGSSLSLRYVTNLPNAKVIRHTASMVSIVRPADSDTLSSVGRIPDRNQNMVTDAARKATNTPHMK